MRKLPSYNFGDFTLRIGLVRGSSPVETTSDNVVANSVGALRGPLM